MKNYLFFWGLLFLSIPLFAQPDYQRKADRFIVQGNYAQAEVNLQAYKAYLDSKKTDKNSDEYIAVEKKLYRIDRCKGLQQTARTASEGYTYAYCDSLVSQANDAESASQIISDIATELNRASGCYGEICGMFPSDTVSANRQNECLAVLEFVSNIDFNEIGDWRNAMAYNTTEAYQSFIRMYPGSARVNLAKEKIRNIEDNALWAVYVSSPTYENCKAYLSAFPNGLHSSQASNDFIALEENWIWDTAVTRSDYINYKKKYPKGRFASQVEDKIAFIDETELWDKATSADDIPSYNSYLKKYPSGYYSKSAYARINRIKDADYWNRALSLDTKQAYEAYLAESPLKAFEEEAENKIAAFIHQENVEADQARWNIVSNSTNWSDYQKYLNEPAPYKSEAFVKEANFRYNIYRAEAVYVAGGDNAQVVSLLNTAMEYGNLTEKYRKMFDDCHEKILFNDFMNNKTQANALKYLRLNNPPRAAEVNHWMCLRIIEQMTVFSSLDEERAKALGYAKTQDDIDAVEKKYQSVKKQAEKLQKKKQKYQNQTDSYSKKSTSTTSNTRISQRDIYKEPFHFILGADLSWNDYVGALSPLVSFGGHSNSFNLEFAFDSYFGFNDADEMEYQTSSIVVRPRWNYVKLKYRGSTPAKRKAKDYSNLYMYAAPEFYIYPFTGDVYYDYGIRLGVGLAPFDFYVGYRFGDLDITYVGVSLYLSRK